MQDETGNLENNFNCSTDCPIRKRLEASLELHENSKMQTRNASRAYYVDKGFTYINVVICLLFYCVAAFDYHRTSTPIPLYFTVLVFLAVIACLGIKTQGIAETIGRFLSK